MDVKKIIKNHFEHYVKANVPKEDVRRFLLTHERRELFESNLFREIIKSFHVIQNKETIISMVEDLSRFFCISALEVKKGEIQKSTKTIKQAQDEYYKEENEPIIFD